MAYQRRVWRDSALQGFDERIDFRAVEAIKVTAEGLAAAADLAAGMDPQIGQSRFAAVVGDHLTYGLSGMYETFREMNASSSRQLMIFHRLEQALAWLDES